MLGNLLSWAPRRRYSRRSSVEKDQLPLESVQEEAHTFDLLFPSSESALSPKHPGHSFQESLRQSAGSFDQLSDDKASVASSDIRVLVAQDDISFLQKLVLFDSQCEQSQASSTTAHPPWNSVKTTPNTSNSSSSSTLPTRKPPAALAKSQSSGPELTSAFIPPRLEEPPGILFRRRQARKTSLSSTFDLDTQNLRKEIKEQPTELQMILDCMFGSLGLRYSGQSTKVHVLPRDEDSPQYTSNRSAREPPISPAKAQFPESRSEFRSGSSRSMLGPHGSTSPVSVLVTRIFTAAPSGLGARGTRGARGKKRSLYAIGLIVTVPQRTLRAHNTGVPRHARDGDSMVGSFVSDAVPSLSSSAGSGWSVLASSALHGSSSSSTSMNIYSSTDIVMKKWDIILRILDHLQRSVENSVLSYSGSSSTAIDFSPLGPGNSSDQPSRPSHTRHLSLLPNDRPSGMEVSRAATSAITRLTQAFATRLVVTGQQSWGAWREEAKGLVRSFRNDVQKGFQMILLTAFLANHLDWTYLLRTSRSRRLRHLSRSMEFTDLAHRPQRTVVICPCKMAARRYIYLLSFFFVRGNLPQGSSRSTQSGSERGSFGTTYPKQWEGGHAIPHSNQGNRGDIRNPFPKAPLSGSPLKNSIDVPTKSTLTNAIENSRQKAASNVFKPGQGSTDNTSPLFKRFGMTESTVDLSSSVPTAHFSTSAGRSYSSDEEMTTSHVRRGSAASSRLLGNLQLPLAAREHQRRDTIDPRNPFWFPEEAEAPAPFQADYQDTAHTPHVRPSNGEAGSDQTIGVSEIPIQTLSTLNIKRDSAGSRSDAHTPSTVRPMPISSGWGSDFNDTSETPNARPTFGDEQPLKFSLNEDDGFIDVDIPSSSLHFPMDSPAAPALPNGSPSVGGSTLGESFLRPNPQDTTRQAPLGGYLPLLNQDLTVQAVKPYAHLERDIRKAMSAEPSPNLCDTVDAFTEGPSSEQWIDMCSSVIADASSCNVKRLRLRRLVRLTEHFNEEDNASEYWTQTDVSEEFLEDTIATPDPHVAEAIDKLLDSSLHISSGASTNRTSDSPSSPSPAVSLSSSQSQSQSQEPPSSSFPGSSSLSESLDSRQSTMPVHGNSRDMAVKGTIVGALEKVLRGAVADVKGREAPTSSGVADGDAETPGDASRESTKRPGSVLHEIVKEELGRCMAG